MMKPIIICGKKPLIMEVVGRKGKQVSEYVVDNKDKKQPYYELTEFAVME